MRALNRRALAYTVTISLITNPAFANSWLEFLGIGKKAVSEGSEVAVKTEGKKTVTFFTTKEGKEIFVAAKFIDQIEKATAGLFKDLTGRVSQNLYAKTLGRSKDVVQLTARLSNPNIEGVALQGADGIGKSQHLIGLQEQINLGNVPALNNSRIIQVSTNNTLAESADSMGRHVEGLMSALDPSTSTVIIHFDNIIRYLPETQGSKFDEILEVLQRKLASKNMKAKFVIEGHPSQIDMLAERNARVKLFARQAVEELPEHQLENIITQYAAKIGAETGYYATPEAIKKLMTLARVHYGNLGMPTAANKLLSDAISLKRTLLGTTESIIATNLGKQKNALEAELEMAKSILNERPAAAYANRRLNAIPKEISALDKKITDVTKSYRRFEELRAELKKIELANANVKIVDDATKESYGKIKAELGQINPEDIALQIHLDKGVSLEELLVQHRPLALEESLEKYQKKLFGQQHVIQTLAEYGQRIRSTVRDLNKPAAKILILGAPGTGKTEAARTAALVEYGSYDKMIRLDMADYAEKHAGSGITGAKPGYAGYGDGNDIVTRINNMPESVLLLDEIEKADMSVINNSFLAALSTGKMLNGSGKVGDLSRTMVIATTNKGQHFTSAATRAEIETYMIGEGFSREFLDRWDEILVADPIDKSLWKFIFDKNIVQINETRLANTLTHLEVSEKATDAILAQVTVGASASARAVEREVAKLNTQIANIIEKGFYKDSKGTSVTLSAKPGDLIKVDWDDAVGLVITVP